MTGMELMETLDWLIPIGFILALLVQLVQVLVVPVLLWKLVKAVRENTAALLYEEENDPDPRLRSQDIQAFSPGILIHNTEEYLR